MILIIDNYDSFTYNLYQIIAQFHDDVRVVRNNKISISEMAHLKPMGIILSPGPGRPENAGICVELIRAVSAGEINASLLGVCLGHQAISMAFGGNIIQSTEISHGKHDWVLHHGNGLYQGLPQPLKVGRYHSLIVERETLPSALIIEAENADNLVMGIRHKDLPIYGVQFHPESILTSDGNLMLQTFVRNCRHKGVAI